MYCRDCPRFDEAVSRCRDGKINPLDWDSALQVSQVMGLRAICTFNDHRERLLAGRKPPDSELMRRQRIH